MRVTIQKTIELDDVPTEINEDYGVALERVQGISQLISKATIDAAAGNGNTR